MLPIAVTIGEPSGVGPEVILKAWFKRKEFNLADFFVIGSATILEKYAEHLSLNVPISTITAPEQTASKFRISLPVLDLNLANEFVLGTPTITTAPMVIGAIEKSVELIMNGSVRAMVTAPIHKAALYEAGFKSPGHTEFLAQICENYKGEPFHPVMMLASEQLCVVPLTIHVALKDVPGLINEEIIIKTVKIINFSMQKYFGLENPRIAISGLNPHAGENNAFGREETDIIIPAIEKLKLEAIRITGPIPADTMFHKAARDKYDVALCMYHDQALIPIKTIDFDAGVNVTLGLPIIRTSPDHGTALNIAGRGLANPTSIINSLKLADRMSQDFMVEQNHSQEDLDY